MIKADLASLKANIKIEDIIERFISLDRRGSEYKGMCPWHDDSKPSLNVNPYKQLFMCPVCDKKKGDVFDFLNAMGYSLPEAIRIVQGDKVGDVQVVVGEGKARKVKTPPWKQVRPIVACTDFTHYVYASGQLVSKRQPTVTYAYSDSDGLVGYVCRFENADGSKETLPFSYTVHPDGNPFMWKYQAFNSWRPLYGADLLAKYPELPVVVVEGEKVADWMNERSGGRFIAVTWLGGSNQVDKSDFSVLNDRRLLFCMDNDEPGLKCMNYVFDNVISHVKKWGVIPRDAKKGWDMADSKLTPNQTQDFVRRNMRDPAPPKHDQDEQYFTYLGFEKSDNMPAYMFYGKQSKTIFRLNAAQMTKASLVGLAPPIFWEAQFPGAKNTDGATAILIGTSYQVGIYSPKNVRGRGAWYDDGRVVIHAGDKLIVDGVVVELGDLDTSYIYEIGESFNFNTENPLPKTEAKKILDITKLLNWERGINAYLLAGWCVIAPVCGALKWRPHIWLTGEASVGKSWTFREVLRRLCGDTILDVQGVTTEAGIRQALQFDALPVAIDEAEGNDQKGSARVQDNIELARSASADDTGQIIKGSAGHNAKRFHIRSCFAFSSISVGVDKSSDRRRITILSLVNLPDKEAKAQRWSELQAIHAEVMSDDFVKGLHARTIMLLPVILENAAVFNAALVSVLGTQAMGDQISPMLAGAWSLTSDKLVTFKEAEDFIKKQDWNEENEAEKVKDEFELISFLMQWKTRAEAWGDRTMSELVSTAAVLVRKANTLPNELDAGVAHAVLKRHGIRIKDGFLLISDNNSEIKDRLKNTRWSKNYSSILKRLPGAVVDNQRFTGSGERCVKFPIALVA